MTRGRTAGTADPAIPAALLESRTFGHVKRVFTGTDSRAEGLFPAEKRWDALPWRDRRSPARTPTQVVWLFGRICGCVTGALPQTPGFSEAWLRCSNGRGGNRSVRKPRRIARDRLLSDEGAALTARQAKRTASRGPGIQLGTETSRSERCRISARPPLLAPYGRFGAQRESDSTHRFCRGGFFLEIAR